MDNGSFIMIDKGRFEELMALLLDIRKVLNSERNQQEKLYTNKAAQNYLSVCSKKLQNYRDSGQIEFIQTGRKIYYKESHLNSFLIKNKKELFKKKLITV